MNANQVATTIAMQMGGTGRIRAMTGAREFIATENGLQVKFPNPQRARGTCIVVTLTPADTSHVAFYNGFKQVAEYGDVYAENLVAIFERQTGLYLTL